MNCYDSSRERHPLWIARLENARRRGCLAHAFLLHADSERTRHEFSIALAKLAACPNSDETGRPCGVCRVCTRLEAGNYPEFYTLAPMGKMYQIKVGERTNPDPNTLRWFEERFHLTNTSGGNCKIGVIRDADRMNDESQNALLKTLEEPPKGTLLILVTANPSALLPTTRSRCQTLSLLENKVEFTFKGFEEVRSALGELCFGGNDLEIAERNAARLIRVAAGLAGDAAEQTVKEWAQRIEAAAQGGDAPLMKRVEALSADAAAGAYMRERTQFLASISAFTGQLYLLSQGAAKSDLANPELLEGVKLPPVIPPAHGDAFRREAEELARTLRFNVSEELALRTFAVNIVMKPKDM